MTPWDSVTASVNIQSNRDSYSWKQLRNLAETVGIDYEELVRKSPQEVASLFENANAIAVGREAATIPSDVMSTIAREAAVLNNSEAMTQRQAINNYDASQWFKYSDPAAIDAPATAGSPSGNNGTVTNPSIGGITPQEIAAHNAETERLRLAQEGGGKTLDSNTVPFSETFGNVMSGVASVAQAGTGVWGAYNAYKANKQAEKEFEVEKAYNATNLANQAKLINNRYDAMHGLSAQALGLRGQAATDYVSNQNSKRYVASKV